VSQVDSCVLSVGFLLWHLQVLDCVCGKNVKFCVCFFSFVEMATKARKRPAAESVASGAADDDQVVSQMGTASVVGVADGDDDETFFQDIDMLQSHGIVSWIWRMVWVGFRVMRRWY
jgi:hypothetical protein